MDEELKACPFCGETLRINNARLAVHSRNSECLLRQQPIVVDDKDQVERWNTRATHPAAASVGGGEAVEVVGWACHFQIEVLRHVPLTGGMKVSGRERERYHIPLMTVAQHNRMMLALVARCYQEGAFKTCLECGYQDGHDQICQYHESKRAAASDDLTNVRCLCCQSEHAHNSYDAGFIAGSGMCQACDAAMPAKDLPAVSAEPVEWQHQAPDGSWWGIAKSRVDEARLAGRPIRPLYTHPADQVAEGVAVPVQLLKIIEQSWRIPNGCPKSVSEEVGEIISNGLAELRALLASAEGGSE